MSIVFFILKALLWFVFGCILTLVVVVAGILVLPIDYCFYGEKYEEICYKLDVRLFYIIQCLYKKEHQQDSLHIKICGITLPRKRQVKPSAPQTKTSQTKSKQHPTQQPKPPKPASIQPPKAPVHATAKTQKETQKHTSSLEPIKELWTSPYRPGALRAAKRLLKRLYRHLKPHTLRFGVCIGKDDPAKTGEWIASLTMFYPLYYQYGWIEGNYEEEGLWGEGIIEGRLRLGKVLISFLAFIIDKNVRALIKKIVEVRKEEKHGI